MATDESVVGGSLGTRHSRVIGKLAPAPRRLRRRRPRHYPASLTSDTGGVAASQPRRQAFACHRGCIKMSPRACGAVSPAHRGPQAPRTARSRPWRREFDGSLCRGGQGLWTLWTADSDLGRGFERRARDYYTVIIGGRWIWRGYLPGSGGSGGRRHFYPSGQGEDAGGCRRDQSSFGSRMVMTGSPSSPGPTTSFSLVSSDSVARPSRGTR